MNNKNQFTGPLFIIGIPRSGTKLLRDLINNHPDIYIPDHESNFIPYIANKYKDKDLSIIGNFKKFYIDIHNSDFFERMEKKGININYDEWFFQIYNYSISNIIETFFRLYAKKEHKIYTIWGDKAPNYINHLPLLRSLFPKSKFIHIIRDGRDVCLSMKKVWGKNIFRSAQRWRADVLKCRSDARNFIQEYYEIKYEILIQNPEDSLNSICKFLGVEFYPQMIHLIKVSEKYGNARGHNRIISTNINKFQKEFSEREIRKIESILGPALITFDYKIYDGKIAFESISFSKMLFYKFLDGLNLIKFNIKDKGILKGTKVFFRDQIKK